MELVDLISFVEENKVGLYLELEGSRILDISPSEKNVDVTIHDLAGLKKMRGELERWRG